MKNELTNSYKNIEGYSDDEFDLETSRPLSRIRLSQSVSPNQLI